MPRAAVSGQQLIGGGRSPRARLVGVKRCGSDRPLIGPGLPELFSGSRVVNDGSYAERVAEQLREMGLCAAVGPPEDEVAVKDVNDFSEQYDLVLGSTQEPWTAHAVTCRPARF